MNTNNEPEEIRPEEIPQISVSEEASSVVGRSTRLIHMMQILSLGSGYTVEELSEFYHLDQRSIRRDLKIITDELHVAITFDKTTRKYEINSQHNFLPALSLTALEAFSLIVLCREFGRKRTIPFFDLLHSAAIKIQSQLSPDTKAYIEKAYRNLDMTGTPRTLLQAKAETYNDIQFAHQNHYVVDMKYYSFTEGKFINTYLYPFYLTFNRHSWFIIGISSLHKEVRIFNIVRIKTMKVLNMLFDIPQDWSYEKYNRNAWNMIPEPGPDSHVIIDFTRKVGGNVEEVLWHKNQKTHWINENTLRFETVVTGLNEISWWILGYGAEATVVEPPELRNIIAGHVRRLCSTYQNELFPNRIKQQ